MANTEKSHPPADQPGKPVIPEPAGDGFPAEKDVSDPPAGSDVDISREPE